LHLHHVLINSAKFRLYIKIDLREVIEPYGRYMATISRTFGTCSNHRFTEMFSKASPMGREHCDLFTGDYIEQR